MIGVGQESASSVRGGKHSLRCEEEMQKINARRVVHLRDVNFNRYVELRI